MTWWKIQMTQKEPGLSRRSSIQTPTALKVLFSPRNGPHCSDGVKLDTNRTGLMSSGPLGWLSEVDNEPSYLQAVYATMDRAPTKEGKKRRAMRRVCIWAALPVRRGGWQFWARLTLRAVEGKRLTFPSEYWTGISLWPPSPQRIKRHCFGWTLAALIKYSTTPDSVWVELPEVFYLSPLGRMSFVWFGVT